MKNVKPQEKSLNIVAEPYRLNLKIDLKKNANNKITAVIVKIFLLFKNNLVKKFKIFSFDVKIDTSVSEDLTKPLSLPICKNLFLR